MCCGEGRSITGRPILLYIGNNKVTTSRGTRTRTKTRPHLQKRKKYANFVSACVISIVTHISYNPRKHKTLWADQT